MLRVRYRTDCEGAIGMREKSVSVAGTTPDGARTSTRSMVNSVVPFGGGGPFKGKSSTCPLAGIGNLFGTVMLKK